MKKGWEYKKLKEVGRTQTGTTPSKSVKSFYGGKIPFIRPAELDIDGNGSIEYNSELKLTSEGALKSRTIKANSTLMCCIGSVGKTGYAIKDVTCNQQINTITPYDGYNGKFVYYALLTPSFQKEVIKIANSAKATLAIISKGKWEEMYIPVPPLSEQQRIVDYLDAAFAKIDAMKANAEKALNEAKALFQASLKEMLEPKEGWEEKTLKEITSEIGDGLHGTPKYSDDGNYFFVNGNNFENGLIEIKDNTKRIGLEEYEKYKIDLNTSTVLLSINGTIGKTAFYDGEPIILGKSACYINVLPALLKEYLRYFFLSDFFVIYAKKNARQATIVNLGLKELRNMPIPLPPLSEQQSIVATLDSLKSKVDRLQANFEKISQECDALKQAILRQIFE